MSKKYIGYSNREALYDLTLTASTSKTAIVFVHGYMGYKDWGAWNKMAETLALTGLPVYKLNLTHNGTTLDHPTLFADLEAFGNGGYWAEYTDLSCFLNHLEKADGMEEFILIGHSRGGGIVSLFAQDKRIKQIHCIAPICSIENRFPANQALENWKNDGVYFKENARTKQSLPHYFKQYEEFVQHKDLLNIEKALHYTHAAVFIYHGDNDTSVPLEEGVAIAKWSRGLFLNFPGANHTFGATEPWLENEMPHSFSKMVQQLRINILQNC